MFQKATDAHPGSQIESNRTRGWAGSMAREAKVDEKSKSL